MPKLTVRRGDATWTIPFESGQRLDEVLIAHDLAVPRPCGGRGVCGKCAVELSGQVSAPNAAERRAGRRLSCQALLMGDALAVLPDDGGMEQIALFSDAAARAVKPTAGRLGAAVDIGTTTLACKLYDLRDGTCLSEAGRRNPADRCGRGCDGPRRPCHGWRPGYAAPPGWGGCGRHAQGIVRPRRHVV